MKTGFRKAKTVIAKSNYKIYGKKGDVCRKSIKSILKSTTVLLFFEGSLFAQNQNKQFGGYGKGNCTTYKKWYYQLRIRKGNAGKFVRDAFEKLHCSKGK